MLKTSSVVLEKEWMHYSCYRRLHFSSLPNSPYFSSGFQKSLPGLEHPSLLISILFWYIVGLVLNIAEIQLDEH